MAAEKRYWEREGACLQEESPESQDVLIFPMVTWNSEEAKWRHKPGDKKLISLNLHPLWNSSVVSAASISVWVCGRVTVEAHDALPGLLRM